MLTLQGQSGRRPPKAHTYHHAHSDNTGGGEPLTGLPGSLSLHNFPTCPNTEAPPTTGRRKALLKSRESCRSRATKGFVGWGDPRARPPVSIGRARRARRPPLKKAAVLVRLRMRGGLLAYGAGAAAGPPEGAGVEARAASRRWALVGGSRPPSRRRGARWDRERSPSEAARWTRDSSA